jgi:hypothetical protein
MNGGLVSQELYGQITDTIKTVRGTGRRSREAHVSPPMRDASRFPTLACILDENLAAVTNPKEPTSALARLCKWSVAESKYVEIEQQITVFNHSFTGYVQDTFGAALFIDGHHWFFGDCSPMDEAFRTEFETEVLPP